VLLILVCSCKKDQPTQKPLSKLTASFSMSKQCNFLLPQEDLQHTDSLILFSNRSFWAAGSDTSLSKSYLWNFGDNSSSNETNPVHKYTTNGIFKITLITFLNNSPSDTITRNIQIIIGQKEFRSTMLNTQAVDIDETPNKGALVLVTNFNTSPTPPSYSLLKVDSLLRQVWFKPVTGSNIRLASLKKTASTDYILSGNYSSGNVDLFSISKIDSSGNLKWVKYITDIQGKNNCTIPTSDGGFLTIGNSTLIVNSPTIVVKFDSNGDETWRKVFNTPQTIQDADNIIETTTGYVFASVIRGFSNNQIVITKLNFSGNILQQNTTLEGDASTIFTAGISQIANTYLVHAKNTKYIYLFADDLSFIRNKIIGESGINNSIAKNSMFYLAQGSFQYSYIRQINTIGDINWSSVINNQLNLSCSSFLIGATRYCKKVIFSGTDELIALSDGKNNSTGFFISSLYIEKFNLAGAIK